MASVRATANNFVKTITYLSLGSNVGDREAHLREAMQMVLEANRELAEQSLAGQSVTKEPFVLS